MQKPFKTVPKATPGSTVHATACHAATRRPADRESRHGRSGNIALNERAQLEEKVSKAAGMSARGHELDAQSPAQEQHRVSYESAQTRAHM